MINLNNYHEKLNREKNKEKDENVKYKALKFRLYPDSQQQIQIAKTFGCARKVYNEGLSYQDSRHDKGEKYLSKTAMNDRCNHILKKEYPYLREVDKFALTNSLFALDAAYGKLFKGKGGHPRFKSKHDSRQSYTTNITNNNIEVGSGFIKLPKLGKVKARIHRTAPDGWTLKSATISRNAAGRYYASILYSYVSQPEERTAREEDVLGLDYSSPYLYIDSNGYEPDYEKQFAKYQEKLAREQRKQAKMREDAKAAGRKLSECRNYQKQKQKVAKIYDKIANCRRDALHKLSKKLADTYDIIAVEDINLRAMSQGLNLGKNTMDNGFGMFRTFLKYKLEDRGKLLVVVDKWYPSTKTCSCCGNTRTMRLSDKEYFCPECGLVIDRDWNAAINIRDEAIRMLTA